MAKIAISDAAFTGLRVMRKNPGAVISWALLYLIIMVGISALVLLRFAGVIAQLQSSAVAMAGADNGNAKMLLATMMPAIHQILPLYGYMILIALVLYSIFISAMNRAVLRPRDTGAGFLRLGPDELRQLIVMIAYAVISLLIHIAMMVIAAAVFVGARAGLRAAAPQAPNAIPVMLAVLVFLAGVLVIQVRLSLASAQTFATKSINLFGSWRLTRGQFWPVFATYLLTFVIYIVVAIVVGIIVALIHFGLAAAGLGPMNGVHLNTTPLHGLAGHKLMFATNMNTLPSTFLQVKDWRGLLPLLTPALVIGMVLRALAMAILIPILLTPPASIFKALTAETARTQSLLNMG